MLFFEFSFRYTHITSKHYTVFIPCAADFSQRSPSNTAIYRIYSTIYIIVCQYPFIIKYHKIRVDRRKFVCNTEDYRMSHDEILRKIVQLRIDKNWSEYRLSMETGIPQSTISSWFRKNVQPSVQSLAAICQACGITLSQFFSSDEDLTVELTVEQKDFLDLFSVLPSEQQKALIAFLRTLKADPTE